MRKRFVRTGVPARIWFRAAADQRAILDQQTETT
jgi:hypothetical protein